MLNLPFSEQNLILTGYLGPNQPLMGRQIAERLRLPIVNVEMLIAERIGLSVDEIRTYYGETRLKSIEAEIMDETLLRRNTVIRVSARTLLHADYLERISETGPVICLVTTLDAMLTRLHISMGARYYDPQERAFQLGELKREWSVRGRPMIHEIDTTYLSDAETMDAVIALWQQLAVVRA